MNREMSPHAESESTPFGEIILASGCKLIVRGVGANKRNSDTVKIMQDAVSQIQKANPDLASIPVLVKPFPTLRADWTTSCYIHLNPSISLRSDTNIETEPRTDLLELWMAALAQYGPKWELAWAPAKPGTDKRMWIRFPEITASYGDQDDARNKIVQWANEKGFTVCSSYFTQKTGVAINLAYPHHVDEIASKGYITIPGLKASIKAMRLRQIKVQNAFEMVITGVPTEYKDMDLLIVKWLREKFQNEGQHTIAGSRTPPNEPEALVFHMITWSETSKVLAPAAQEAFKSDFAKYSQSLTPPQMLHQLNTNGIFKSGPTRTEKVIEGGVSAIDKNFRDLRCLIDENQQKNQQQHTATQLQLASVTSTLSNVTQMIAGLEERVVTTQRAILAQSQELALARNLSDNANDILNLEFRTLIETDPVKKAQLQEMTERMVERKRILKAKAESSSCEFLSIISGPIGQLQQTPATPSTPPGLSRPTINLRRSSATIANDDDEPDSVKKRRIDNSTTADDNDVSQIAEVEQMVTDNEPVRLMNSVTSNTLIATHDDIPVSVMTKNKPETQPKSLFRGVLDKLRDFSGYRRSCTPFCRPPPANSCPKLFLIIALLIITMSTLQTAQAASPMTSTSTFSIYALNANGLVQPVKLNHINNVINARSPHAFVIGETKTQAELNNSLPCSEYDIYEEAGECAENHHIFKWGIVMGIRKDIQVAQRLEIKQKSLKGRVIALDIILPMADGRCLPHRIFGAYAPWNPGDEGDSKSFWNDMTQLCRSTTTPWSIAGDLNATVASFERHSGGTEARRQYLQFLQATESHDLWMNNPDRTRLNDWTCRSTREGCSSEGNIIDRVASSSSTLIDSEIYVTDRHDDWIPCTDHRAIFARITHTAVGVLTDPLSPDTRSNFTRQPSGPPRIKMPTKTEKHKYNIFQETVDTLIEAESLHERQIVNVDSFMRQYNDLTRIITTTADNVFGRTKPYIQMKPKVTNAKIKGIVCNLQTIGGAIFFERSKRTVHISPKAMQYHMRAIHDHQRSGDRSNLLQFLIKRRRILHKSLYAERAKEIILRAKESDKRRMIAALKGSTKRMVQTSGFVPLPLALNDLDQPDKLVCDPEGVKATTRKYFEQLYDHSRVRELPKPWLTTPSVTTVKNRVVNDQFQWPRKASLADFRAMIRRGNHRPSPGPDRWEKWTIKSLSDRALSLVLDLHNYEVMNSCFPGNITDIWLTTIFKRGLRTDLKNWRGVSFSNFLANSPMTWLNQCLIRYAAEKSILPDTQVAAQPGVQTCDLMSYLAGIKCWANRHKQPIYAIKRDQMKGFDYLSPEGFYDAIRAYGLPSTIIDLDKAAQAQVQCFIHTAYGATSPITISGVSKQGGPASPLKSTFTTSMGHYYLCDLIYKDEDALVITPTSNERRDPHLMDAQLQLQVAMVEATDDSYIFSRSADSLIRNTLAMERFQYAYGWQTQWAKSNAYIIAPAKEKTYPDTITFESVTIGGREVDPLKITKHTIALIKNDLDFLRTKVDNPSARFKDLQNFIETFQFPTIIGRLPITLIRKIVAQNIISKCRALLSLQPILPADAEKLDKLIIGKVHKTLGFPFQPTTDIATLPTAQHGFGFPSIARINAGLAIEGLQRDLNHHIPAYRNMALITKADWTCEKNQCMNPLDGIGLRKDFTRQVKSIPANWIIAQCMMCSLSLSLRETDQSHLAKGDVSLSHAVHIYNHKISSRNPSDKINGTTLKTLQRMGINTIQDFRKWNMDKHGAITLQSRQLTFDRSWTQAARKNWKVVAVLLRDHLRLDDMVSGPLDLAIPRQNRQTNAENQIRDLVHICGFPPSRATDGKTWASDGPMTPASASMMDEFMWSPCGFSYSGPTQICVFFWTPARLQLESKSTTWNPGSPPHGPNMESRSTL
jgi:hypothetical protein